MISKDISLVSMGLAYMAILITLFIFRFLNVKLYVELLVAVVRMGAQLLLVGLYLTFLFKWNSLYLNIGYIMLMLAVANASVLRNSGLKVELFSHTFPALTIGIGLTLAYYTLLVFTPDPLFDARYVIPIAGMLLGNSMSRTIVTLERFYSSIRKDFEGYASLVTMGASVEEAILPYMRTAYKAGLGPSIANMATMGIVFLPGMMTGQLLGGASPMVAIKYQIAIVLAIFVATELATLLAIYFSLRKGFDSYSMLRMEIFKK